jgi:hypothetical protein
VQRLLSLLETEGRVEGPAQRWQREVLEGGAAVKRSTFFSRIERALHPKRPHLRDLHGREIFAVLCARIAHDAPQALELPPNPYGPACGGYFEDTESTKAQRFLLRLLT